jgi:putative ABC transport system substrate-binding protein
MSDLVARKVDVIVTVSTPAAIAAKDATKTVPIVAVGIGDPIGSGLAKSLAQPGGNVTGISYGFSEGFAGKWLELLRECVPQLKTIALVYNPESAWSLQQRKDLEAIVSSLGLKMYLVEVTNLESVKNRVAKIGGRAQGVIVVGDPVTVQSRVEIAALANRQRLPTVTSMLEFADAGALMSYGVDNTAVFRRMAEYVDKILRGTKPGELPIEQPTQLSLAVNARTAALIGVSIPSRLVEQADKVIR